MSQRLVTQKDLDKHPELASKGVSVNQFYDFDAEYPEDDDEDDEDWQAPRPTPKKTPEKKAPEKEAPAKSAPAANTSSNKKSK